MDAEELRKAGIEVVPLDQIEDRMQQWVQLRKFMRDRKHDEAMEVVSGTHNHRQTKER